MDTIQARTVSGGRPSGIARSLAVILLGLAALIGLVAVLAAVMICTGDRKAIPILAGTGPTAWGLGWLGMVLWSGRSIPRWFIIAFFVTICVIPMVGALVSGSWADVTLAAGALVPSAVGFWGAVRDYRTKPPRPPEFDDFA